MISHSPYKALVLDRWRFAARKRKGISLAWFHPPAWQFLPGIKNLSLFFWMSTLHLEADPEPGDAGWRWHLPGAEPSWCNLKWFLPDARQLWARELPWIPPRSSPSVNSPTDTVFLGMWGDTGLCPTSTGLSSCWWWAAWRAPQHPARHCGEDEKENPERDPKGLPRSRVSQSPRSL